MILNASFILWGDVGARIPDLVTLSSLIGYLAKKNFYFFFFKNGVTSVTSVTSSLQPNNHGKLLVTLSLRSLHFSPKLSPSCYNPFAFTC